MTADWLSEYLADALERDLCTTIHCSTCGAREFRRGVWDALSRSQGGGANENSWPSARLQMAKALAGLPQVEIGQARAEAAVRCVIFDLWSGIPNADEDLKRLLAGSWAGQILESMQRHHAAREAARRERAKTQDPVYVQRLRDEKRVARQIRHQQRLAGKKERDRIWQQVRLDVRCQQDVDAEVIIQSRDYWFKIVEFLQQNWSLIDQADDGVVVWFFSDTAGVFDEMKFPSEKAAVDALRRNGFQRYAEDPDAQKFRASPKPPFRRCPHPNGRIYSSGRFWKIS